MTVPGFGAVADGGSARKHGVDAQRNTVPRFVTPRLVKEPEMIEKRANLEWIEAEAWCDVMEAVPATVADRLGLFTARIGATRIVRASGIDHILFNRAFGLGVAERATRETVDQVVDAYHDVGVPRYFVHVSPAAADADLGAWLERRGLERYPRRWAKLVRGADPVGEASTDWTIRPARPEDAPSVARLVAAAFDVPDEGDVLFASLVGRPRWHLYVALEGGSVAAAAGLFADNHLGYIAFAATRPEARCRGAQRALLHRRLEDGLKLGCRAFVSETGEAVPDDPQHSYNNLLKAGFREHYLRENYAPRGVRWGQAA